MAPRSTPQLKEVLTSKLCEDVRSLWFQHLPDDAHLIVPGQEQMKRWFSKDEAFDRACVAQFRPVLETIRQSNATAAGILAAARPDTPLDWLSIILLLDQIPRNCYRDEESALVFSFFDPLVEDVALQAIGAGIPTQSSPVRYRIAYRMWFSLPLMHSERAAVHDIAVQQHENLARDVDDLLRQDQTMEDEDALKCRTILRQQREAAQKVMANSLDFEKRHQAIIARFGRYPHRNEALGRTPTTEEIEYLESGGETFG